MPTTADTPCQPDHRAPLADQAALIWLGDAVRGRIGADPTAYRIPTEKAEMWAFADFLSPAECDRMMALVDLGAKPSSVFNAAYDSAYRTSYSGDVDRADPLVRMIERRLDDLLGIEPAWGETIQGQRYLPGQEFREHCDWFWTLGDYWPDEAGRGGQRGWTAMVYLNAVEAGGATDFVRLGISITPQPGALLVWNNATPGGAPNWDTMHAALPVVQGVKYVITKWYRTRKWG
ncbi:MAG: 2OG-Fe(II) oxygenase [Pseudomonadota bacterium]